LRQVGRRGVSRRACRRSQQWRRFEEHSVRLESSGRFGTPIRRPRLLRAADRLANSDTAISTIADSAGYRALDAFGRPFKGAYGQTPADYRAKGSHAAFKVANRDPDTAGFSVITVMLPPVRCAAIAHAGSYMQTDKAMGRFFTELASKKVAMQDQ
jgi:AraC family transcriptional regulator